MRRFRSWCSRLLPYLALALLFVLTLPTRAQPLDPTGPAATLGWQADIQGRFILSLATDTTGRIWVGTEDQGIWRYDGEAPNARRWTHFTTQEGLGDDNAYALAVDKQGRVWAGHLNHGVSVWNGRAWKNYGVLDGPLGERIFDIAVCPTDGDVWLATSSGLARYRVGRDDWLYYTTADGLPSNQTGALAFDHNGNLYAGTQCDGIALASAAGEYKTWRTVRGPARMPNVPTGPGLPSNLINDLLVARDGSIYVATTCGLARSDDGGQSWSFIRGLDWEANVKGLYRGPQPVDAELPGDLLMEDWVTTLAEDRAGMLWIGFRQQGFEIRDPHSDQRAFSSVGEFVGNANDYVRALLIAPRLPPLIGYYGDTEGGLGTMRTIRRSPDAEANPSAPPDNAAPFPSPAKPPTARDIEALLQRIPAAGEPLAPGAGAYLGEDWRTWGDWAGRYGRDYAVLCAMMSPTDHTLTWSQDYAVEDTVGPHYKDYRGRYGWIQWLKTDNPKVLYNPILGHRRQGEWNDGAFDQKKYPFSHEGPDLWAIVTVPEGAHRVSLYFYNKDGHDGRNRYRDYLVELKRFMDDPDAADAQPALARARVRDFWGGVYKQFAVSGPGKFLFKIGRNRSHVTMLQAVMIDKLPLQRNPRFKAMAWTGDVPYDPPEAELTAAGTTETTRAAGALWSAIDMPRTDSAAWQWPYRILAYRTALAGDTPPAVLKNWRWQLPLWTDEDRAEFGAVMAQAWQAQLKITPGLEPKK